MCFVVRENLYISFTHLFNHSLTYLKSCGGIAASCKAHTQLCLLLSLLSLLLLLLMMFFFLFKCIYKHLNSKMLEIVWRLRARGSLLARQEVVQNLGKSIKVKKQVYTFYTFELDL